MARVTIEDCLLYVENRFKLVLVAAQRARDILCGSPILTNKDEKEEEKADVTALREIGAGLLDTAVLDEAIIKKYQKYQPVSDKDNIDAPDSTAASSYDEAYNSDANDVGNEIITNMYASESCEDEFEEEEKK